MRVRNLEVDPCSCITFHSEGSECGCHREAATSPEKHLS